MRWGLSKDPRITPDAARAIGGFDWRIAGFIVRGLEVAVIDRAASRRLTVLVVVAVCLPVLMLVPVQLGHSYGPVLHLGDQDSASYLDLWGVLSILTALLLVIPGSVAAWKLRGPWAGISVIIWLCRVAAFAYRWPRWIS